MIEILAKQFRRPDGLLGRLAGKIMLFENRRINRWTIDLLNIKPGDYLLEIGFGPGYAIKEIFRRHHNVKIDGIDVSVSMTKEAEKRNSKNAEEGRLQLYSGDVSDFKQDLYRYDKVFSVNNYPLWKNPKKELIRIHHLMKDGGTIAITVQPREEDASREKALSHAIEIEQALFHAGFRSISVKFKKIRPQLTVCVTAHCKKN
ncbi:class I SAM-dependent methyltransferase [Peribacillus sp. B-H-3]|uniref:class I SAM-dependent methyltransferase n=1 Tax=Peribacillus sp. B-H-3 TaxID=3400420 RepID=UPI003B0222B2